uniref:NADH dehydrogenase subunit 4 n=1 Tax=Barbronia yunnanensis TaxID=3027017 RepID=UPI0023D85529|nr:NADH dehydrogenase subunit 4 [Barbronia yunnanensis]WDA96192.1 NADH dehydrogenase subunit 4 [Barbronia yunnanensis]
MLKLLMPLILSTFINKYSWVSKPMILMLTSMLMLPMLSKSMFFYKISKWSMLDQLSMPLLMLTMWISAMMIMASMKIKWFDLNVKMFLPMIMLLNLILLLSFLSSNLLIFYIWFEASLIPTMLLIMKWGYQPERLQASIYLMMYTIMASLPMLMSILSICKFTNSYEMSMWFTFIYPYLNNYMWFICLIGFLVKLPMFLAHLWLPKAHVEAPVAGSMILAAILLKLGGYGTIRMSSLFPWLNKSMSSIIISISLIGGIITSLICLRQSDLKSLIAYSSVSHMGLMIAGVMTSSKWGLMGAMAMMIAHGFSSSALFIMANINYELMSTRSVFLSKGVLIFSPIMTLWWFLFTIMNMAAPPSINLMSEIMLLTSVTHKSLYSMMALGLISFLTAGYSLYMYSAINHGSSNNYSNSYPAMTKKDMLLLMYHFTPSLFIIMKPELIML